MAPSHLLPILVALLPIVVHTFPSGCCQTCCMCQCSQQPAAAEITFRPTVYPPSEIEYCDALEEDAPASPEPANSLMRSGVKELLEASHKGLVGKIHVGGRPRPRPRPGGGVKPKPKPKPRPPSGGGVKPKPPSPSGGGVGGGSVSNPSSGGMGMGGGLGQTQTGGFKQPGGGAMETIQQGQGILQGVQSFLPNNSGGGEQGGEGGEEAQAEEAQAEGGQAAGEGGGEESG